MARDPNTPRDIERERQRLLRMRAPDPDEAGYVAPAGQVIPSAVNPGPDTPRRSFGDSLSRSLSNEIQGAVDTVGAPLSYAYTGFQGGNPNSSNLSPEIPTTVAPPIPPQVNLIDPANLPVSSGELRSSRAGTGLTRIVKTGDGTYVQTSDPNVRGQERIYDALGNRADVNTNQIIAENQGIGTQRLAQLEDQATSDMGTAEGRNRILERGRDSLARTGRMRDEATSLAARQFMDALDPKTRANLLSEQAKEAGLDRRAAATLQVQQQGQRAASINAQVGLTRQGIDVDRYERERLSNPETRGMAVREFFGSLEGLPEQERIARLTGTPEGRRIMDAATQTLREQTGSRDLTPAQLTRSNGLLRAIGAGPYTDGRSYFGDYVDPQTGGFGDTDIETLRRAYLQQYVGR